MKTKNVVKGVGDMFSVKNVWMSLVFCLVIFGLIGVADAQIFTEAIGGSGFDFAYSITQPKEGEPFAVTGPWDYNGVFDAFIAKFDSSGGVLWAKGLGDGYTGGNGIDNSMSVIETSDGGFVITGETCLGTGGGGDLLIAKFDDTGTFMWAKAFGGPGWERGLSVIETHDGKFAVAGLTTSFGAVGWDILIAKFDPSTLTFDWAKTVGGNGDEVGGSVIEIFDGSDYFLSVTGWSGSFGTMDIPLVMLKCDDGSLQWAKVFKASTIDRNDVASSMIRCGNLFITGYTSSFNAAGDEDLLIAEFDISGNPTSAWTIGGPDDDCGHSLVVTSSPFGLWDGVVIAGVTESFGAGGKDVLLTKFDPFLTNSVLWTWIAGGSSDERGFSVKQASYPDNRFFVAGVTASWGMGYQDVLLAIFDSDDGHTCLGQSVTPSLNSVSFTQVGTLTDANFAGTLTVILSTAVTDLTPTVTPVCFTRVWPMFCQNAKRTELSPYEAPVPLPWEDVGIIWEGYTAEGIWHPVIANNGMIYAGTELGSLHPNAVAAGRLYAYWPWGGSRWVFDVPTPWGKITNAPAIGEDGKIYVFTDEQGADTTPYDNVFALDSDDGSILWRLRLGLTPATGAIVGSSPGIGGDGTIYVGTYEGVLAAINPWGTIKWQTDPPIAPGEHCLSSPAITDGIIYIGTTDYRLVAVQDQGQNNWDQLCELNLGNRAVIATPTIGADGTVYVGTAKIGMPPDGEFWAVNPDCTEKWHIPNLKAVLSSAAIDENEIIYFCTIDYLTGTGELYAVQDLGPGSYNILWTYTTPTGRGIISSPAIGDNGIIVFGCQDGYLYALENVGNQPVLRWKVQTAGPISSSPAIGADHKVYISSDDPSGSQGYLYAIGAIPAPGPDPDLVITHMEYWAPNVTGPPKIGDYVGYNLTIKNVGDAEARGPFTIRVWLNNEPLIWGRYPPEFVVAPGEIFYDQQYTNTTFSECGANEIKAKVDSEDEVKECNETNNERILTVNVTELPEKINATMYKNSITRPVDISKIRFVHNAVNEKWVKGSKWPIPMELMYWQKSTKYLIEIDIDENGNVTRVGFRRWGNPITEIPYDLAEQSLASLPPGFAIGP